MKTQADYVTTNGPFLIEKEVPSLNNTPLKFRFIARKCLNPLLFLQLYYFIFTNCRKM